MKVDVPEYKEGAGLVLVDRRLLEEGVFLAYTTIKGIECSEEPSPIAQLIEESIRRVKEGVGDPRQLKDHRMIRPYRSFLWRRGIDPTKVRPSHEALARRVLRGAAFPRVNPIVDVGNIVSLISMIPIGLYDLEKLYLPLKLTLATGGEVFEPIGGSPRKLDRGTPVLLDSEGGVVHIYPHRDSTKTKVEASTRSVLVIAGGVPGVERDSVVHALRLVCDILERAGCRRECSDITVVGG